ncbi:AIR synthase-related protein, partial [Mobiluncus curtisii]
ATSELAANGDSGMHVDLEKVLLRDPTLTAGEILMSESQERMMAIVSESHLSEFVDIVSRWDVEYAVIGKVTGDGRLTVDHHGQRIVDVDPKTVAIDSPVYDRPYAKPSWQDALNANTVLEAMARDELAMPGDTDPEKLRQEILDVCVTSPNEAAKNWV